MQNYQSEDKSEFIYNDLIELINSCRFILEKGKCIGSESLWFTVVSPLQTECFHSLFLIRAHLGQTDFTDERLCLLPSDL